MALSPMRYGWQGVYKNSQGRRIQCQRRPGNEPDADRDCCGDKLIIAQKKTPGCCAPFLTAAPSSPSGQRSQGCTTRLHAEWLPDKGESVGSLLQRAKDASRPRSWSRQDGACGRREKFPAALPAPSIPKPRAHADAQVRGTWRRRWPNTNLQGPQNELGTW